MVIVVVACRSAHVEEKSGGGGNGAVCHAVSDSLPSGMMETAAGEGREAAAHEDYCWPRTRKRR
jgi:hypothetical protein